MFSLGSVSECTFTQPRTPKNPMILPRMTNSVSDPEDSLLNAANYNYAKTTLYSPSPATS